MSFEFGNNFGRLIICSWIKHIDPFSKENVGKGADSQPVHIRVQQRNGRKTLTTIQGLDEELDKKKVLKVFKKVLLIYYLNNMVRILIVMEQ